MKTRKPKWDNRRKQFRWPIAELRVGDRIETHPSHQDSLFASLRSWNRTHGETRDYEWWDSEKGKVKKLLVQRVN